MSSPRSESPTPVDVQRDRVPSRSVSRSRSLTNVITNVNAYSVIIALLTKTIVPLLLLLLTPHCLIALWFVSTKCHGSFVEFGSKLRDKNLLTCLRTIWQDVHVFNPFAVGVVLAYMSWALVMMQVLPGDPYNGPETSTGHIPVYKDNGLLYYFTTLATLALLTPVLKSYGYSPTLVYDNFGDILGFLCVFSYIFCIFLYFKGIYSPSTPDHSTTDNVIFDYFWGTELYPRVNGIDIKLFTNCRFGMMAWPLLVVICAMKSYELHGCVDSMAVTTCLQLLYITKFFHWESGYMKTMDIMLDRTGFYICWGCLVFIPGLYASVSLYMVTHPVILRPFLATSIFSFGLFSLAVNYLADLQKVLARESQGICVIWGTKARVIRAHYTLSNGQERETILLVSGYWGLARHFHYLPELSLALAWTLPALTENLLPYTYFLYLIVLLVHRTYRDDEKCLQKYGRYWMEYTSQDSTIAKEVKPFSLNRYCKVPSCRSFNAFPSSLLAGLK